MGTATMQKWVYSAWVWFVVVTASTELSPSWHTYIPEPIIALRFHSQRQLQMTSGSLHCIEDIPVCVFGSGVFSLHISLASCVALHIGLVIFLWCFTRRPPSSGLVCLYFFVFCTRRRRRSGDDHSFFLS